MVFGAFTARHVRVKKENIEAGDIEAEVTCQANYALIRLRATSGTVAGPH